MAASVAVPAFGLLFQKENTTSATFSTIIEITKLDGPSLTRGAIDVTHMQSPSNTKEYIGGMRDLGEVSFTAHFVPTNALHKLIYADMIRGADYSDNIDGWKIVFPDASFGGAATSTVWGPIKGFVTGFKPSAVAGDEALMVDVTVKLSGIQSELP